MAARVLDLAKTRVRRRGRSEISGADIFDEIKSAAIDLDASDMETVTACAYAVLSIKDSRAMFNDPHWPHTANDGWIALHGASVMAEQYEKGSVCNVIA